MVKRIKEFFQKRDRGALDDFWYSMQTPSSEATTDNGALSVPAVYACVRVLAESISSLPLIVYKRDGEKRERARDHILYKILHDAPNPFMSALSFRETLVGHVCLRGNAFVLIERDRQGDVTGLYPLHPDRIRVMIEGGNLIYEYTRDGQVLLYPPSEILHFKGLSTDGLQGLSPLALLRDTIGQALAVKKYSMNFFTNSARPSGMISHPNKLSDTAYANLRNSFAAAYSGASNAGKLLVCEEGITYHQLGLSNEDAQLVESNKFSVIEIARAFRVPLNLIMDYDRSTYSNVTEQNRSFATHTLMPWVTRFEMEFNNKLFPSDEYFCAHLLDNLLRGDHKSRYECYEIAKKNGWLSVNEIRAFENMSPIPQGDEYAKATYRI